MAGPLTEIHVRLRPYQAIRCLAKQVHEIRRPFVVGAVDLTNCIRLQSTSRTRWCGNCPLTTWLLGSATTKDHGLRRLYVEVAGEGNFRHLSALLSLCRYIKHVHGPFSDAFLHCRNIIAILHDLETFTFTSELPSYKQPDPTALLDVLVMVVDSDNDPVTEWIREARLRHDWTKMRLLCVLLFPEKPLSFCYLTAGIAYCESLRLVFSTALKYLV
ncbi:hypothetical protein MRX96_017455 [Rhipicephalus microplus]